MALLEQHSPSSPVFHNLRRFIDAVSPTAPTTGLPLQGNPVATADANQNCVTIIRHSFLFLARSLASLISIFLSFRALFTPSIHPKLVKGLNGKEEYYESIDGKTERAQQAYVRGTSEKPRMAAWRIAMATDPGMAHMR